MDATEGQSEAGSAPDYRAKKQKAPGIEWMPGAFLNLIPAVTYVPTQLPVQYHRLSEA